MHTPAHSLWPAGHVPPQVLPSHVAVPPSGAGQGSQDVPQVATSALSTQSSSQAWKPSAQVKPHWVPSQVAVPWSGMGHSVQEVGPQEVVAVSGTQTPAQS
jgi:hypothetical protein